jgi:hypothetical protein
MDHIQLDTQKLFPPDIHLDGAVLISVAPTFEPGGVNYAAGKEYD